MLQSSLVLHQTLQKIDPKVNKMKYFKLTVLQKDPPIGSEHGTLKSEECLGMFAFYLQTSQLSYLQLNQKLKLIMKEEPANLYWQFGSSRIAMNSDADFQRCLASQMNQGEVIQLITAKIEKSTSDNSFCGTAKKIEAKSKTGIKKNTESCSPQLQNPIESKTIIDKKLGNSDMSSKKLMFIEETYECEGTWKKTIQYRVTGDGFDCYIFTPDGKRLR